MTKKDFKAYTGSALFQEKFIHFPQYWVQITTRVGLDNPKLVTIRMGIKAQMFLPHSIGAEGSERKKLIVSRFGPKKAQ